MILYHVVSIYQLLNAIVHSFKQNKKKVIICSNGLRSKCINFDKMTSFFDTVIEFDINYRYYHSKEETYKYFRALIGDFDKYSEILVWAAHFSFGVTLHENGIQYVFCEDAAGLLSRPEVLRDIDKKSPIKCKYYTLMESCGCYDATSKYVNKRLCNIEAQSEEVINDSQILSFNVIREIQNMSVEERNEVLNFFGIEKQISIIKNGVLILTQHLSNMFVITFNKQVLLYQMLVDYFFHDKNIVIKPHPDDLMYYSKLFPEAQIIREKFPSEFMPFVFNNQPKCIATISSTSVFNLFGVYENIFQLDTIYEKDFEKTHRYFVVVSLMKIFNRRVKILDCNLQLIKRLCDVVGVDSLVDNDGNNANIGSIIVVDDYTTEKEEERSRILRLLQNLNNDDCVIFINSHDEYCWYDYHHRELWNNIIPVVLKKDVHQPQSEDFYADTEDEVIYVYSKNKELLNMVREVEMDKVLPHTGITVRKEILTSEQERIKMLEGILEATEKRLLYYIEKENQNK